MEEYIGKFNLEFPIVAKESPMNGAILVSKYSAFFLKLTAAIDKDTNDLFVTGFIGTFNNEDYDTAADRTLFIYRIDSQVMFVSEKLIMKTGDIVQNISFVSYLWPGVYSIFIDDSGFLWWRVFMSRQARFGNVTIGLVS